MIVTDSSLKPEFHRRPWQMMERGARMLDDPAKVMWDIDDVLFPTMYSIHDLARDAGLHNGDVEPRWSGWEVYKLPDGTPCPPEVYWDLWSDFAAAGGYTKTPPIPEAAEALRELYFAGHEIHLVTARGFMAHAEDIRRWTVEWVEEWALPWHTLTFAKDKPAAMRTLLETGPFDPPQRFEDGLFDYAIDDSPRNVEALIDAGVNAYLLDHAHNLDHDGVLPRVPSASAFVKMILEDHSDD